MNSADGEWRAAAVKPLRLPRAQMSGINKFVDGQSAISRILIGPETLSGCNKEDLEIFGFC